MIQASKPPADPRIARRFVARGRPLDLSRPLVMGILNVTPDSFSDGGLYADPARAEERALELEREGADILDVGAESTRPGARPVDQSEEEARLLPVLRRIVPKLRIPVSVDTYKPRTLLAALDLGAAILNDVTGLRDPESARAAARAGAGVIVMHMRGTPEMMQADTRYGDLLGDVEAALRRSADIATDAGIRPESIAVDPGIGFGKSLEDNFRILSGLPRLRSLGYALAVGVSRKGFLRKAAGDDPVALRALNAACHAFAASGGADILRAHDVADTRRVAEMAAACRVSEAE